MLIVTGTLLVLCTWGVAVAGLVALGLVPSLVTEHGPTTLRTLARAAWWGLLVVTVLAAFVAAVVPLRSTTSSVILSGLAIVGAMVGLGIIRRRSWVARASRSGAGVVLIAVSALVGVFVAASALGPVTNYDTGLYHLGAIHYAMDYRTIPGLANLYGPLGYGNGEFTLAALFGNGPLGAEGYRALNGVAVLLALLELATRALRRRWTAGTFVLLVGLTVSIAPMLSLVDYWVTSPSQDAPVMILTVVASSYLVDALSRDRCWVPDAATASALAVLLVLLRPTMLSYAVVLFGVVSVRAWYSRPASPEERRGWAIGVVAVAGAFTLLATVVRDYLLSGWLLYPLSILPFDVSWRAVDPTELRQATLGFWRNPQDIWGSLDGWSWVGPWLAALPDAWETYLLIGLTVAAVAALGSAGRLGTIRWRRLILAVAPSAAAAVTWFLASPPGFRFGWGSLFTLLSVPIGWSLWRIACARPASAGMVRRVCVGGAAVTLAAATVVGAATQPGWGEIRRAEVAVGPLSIPFGYAPTPSPSTTEVETDSGLRLRVPTRTDQCWDVYPLCTPRPSPSLLLRGPDLADGFLP